jgi:hypothetical protein
VGRWRITKLWETWSAGMSASSQLWPLEIVLDCHQGGVKRRIEIKIKRGIGRKIVTGIEKEKERKNEIETEKGKGKGRELAVPMQAYQPLQEQRKLSEEWVIRTSLTTASTLPRCCINAHPLSMRA